MFELAAAASCMPCHADWLNDLSLMPPVSVTMQPRNLAPDAAAVLDVLVLAEVDALAAGVPPALLTLDVLRLRAVLTTAGRRGRGDQRRSGRGGLQRGERVVRRHPVRRMRAGVRVALDA